MLPNSASPAAAAATTTPAAFSPGESVPTDSTNVLTTSSPAFNAALPVCDYEPHRVHALSYKLFHGPQTWVSGGARDRIMDSHFTSLPRTTSTSMASSGFDNGSSFSLNASTSTSHFGVSISNRSGASPDIGGETLDSIVGLSGGGVAAGAAVTNQAAKCYEMRAGHAHSHHDATPPTITVRQVPMTPCGYNGSFSVDGSPLEMRCGRSPEVTTAANGKRAAYAKKSPWGSSTTCDSTQTSMEESTDETFTTIESHWTPRQSLSGQERGEGEGELAFSAGGESTPDRYWPSFEMRPRHGSRSLHILNLLPPPHDRWEEGTSGSRTCGEREEALVQHYLQTRFKQQETKREEMMKRRASRRPHHGAHSLGDTANSTNTHSTLWGCDDTATTLTQRYTTTTDSLGDTTTAAGADVETSQCELAECYMRQRGLLEVESSCSCSDSHACSASLCSFHRDAEKTSQWGLPTCRRRPIISPVKDRAAPAPASPSCQCHPPPPPCIVVYVPGGESEMDEEEAHSKTVQHEEETPNDTTFSTEASRLVDSMPEGQRVRGASAAALASSPSTTALLHEAKQMTKAMEENLSTELQQCFNATMCEMRAIKENLLKQMSATTAAESPPPAPHSALPESDPSPSADPFGAAKTASPPIRADPPKTKIAKAVGVDRGTSPLRSAAFTASISSCTHVKEGPSRSTAITNPPERRREEQPVSGTQKDAESPSSDSSSQWETKFNMLQYTERVGRRRLTEVAEEGLLMAQQWFSHLQVEHNERTAAAHTAHQRHIVEVEALKFSLEQQTKAMQRLCNAAIGRLIEDEATERRSCWAAEEDERFSLHRTLDMTASLLTREAARATQSEARELECLRRCTQLEEKLRAVLAMPTGVPLPSSEGRGFVSESGEDFDLPIHRRFARAHQEALKATRAQLWGVASRPIGVAVR